MAAVARSEGPPGDAQLSPSGLRKRRLAALADPDSWALQVEERAAIDIGTCVRVSLSGNPNRSRLRMHDQGVVVEVVPAYQPVLSTGVLRLLTPIADEPRWVVECQGDKKVIRRAAEMVIVCL
jgi:hypothetical protein